VWFPHEEWVPDEGPVASPKRLSVAAEVTRGIALPPLDVDDSTLAGIAAPLLDLMKLVQDFLIEQGCAWYHPTDSQFLARHEEVNLIVVIQATFVEGGLLDVTLTRKSGGSDAFTRFGDALARSIGDREATAPE
jgi:hypothetical protein